MRYFLIVPLLLLLPTPLWAADYYVCDDGTDCNAGDGSGWVTGNDGNACTSKSSPCLTISGGLDNLAAGDTLTIGDGTYTGTSNCINLNDTGYLDNAFADGTSGNEITIQAENKYGVTIDGEGVRRPWAIGQVDYVEMRGIIFYNSSNDVFYCHTCEHYKVIDCLIYEGGGDSGIATFYRGRYNLFEGCAAWGQGRYGFYIYGGYEMTSPAYTIVRRCVARLDTDNAGRPKAAFSTYYTDEGNGTSHVYLQNCIAIDCLPFPAGGDRQFGAGWYAPNGTNDIVVDSSIFLNVDGYSLEVDDGSTEIEISNSVVWDTKTTYTGMSAFLYGTTTGTTLDGLTIGESAGTHIRFASNSDSVTNSIIYNATSIGLYVTNSADVTTDYNVYYGNTTDFDGDTDGANDYCAANSNAIDPTSNGLLYLPRIEAGSTLKTAGSGGAQIGAEIMYELGTAETLYGETGWNTLGSTELWPWKNEETIRTYMRAYSLHSIDGTRGFCATGETLTKYIWEYLGNTIPTEIYGNPAAITGCTISGGTVQ